MAYPDDEASVANSAPVELYKFAGTYAMYCYTSGPEDMEFDDGSGVLTYQAIAIERTEVKVGTQDDDGTDLTVKMSVIQQIVIDYGFTTSPPDLTLTIYRIQPTGFGIYWQGPVTNISVDDRARASLNCPSSLGAALVGNVPNVYYQTPCNNTLYDVRCKVDYATYSNATTVSAVSADGKTVTVAGIGALDGLLIGGELALGTGEIRMITAQAGDDLTVNFPFNTIDIGGACIIAAGCDHMYRGDCKNKFANQINFNGFMFIPPDNPFASGIDPANNGVTDDACVFVSEAMRPDWLTVRLVFTNITYVSPFSSISFDANDDGTYGDALTSSASFTESGGYVTEAEFTFFKADGPDYWSGDAVSCQIITQMGFGSGIGEGSIGRVFAKKHNQFAFVEIPIELTTIAGHTDPPNGEIGQNVAAYWYLHI